jgi:hypothetical protein
MKTKSFLIAALIIGASASYAQQVEIDDMYFTSKDRALLNASKPAPTVNDYEDQEDFQTNTTAINPTDSYSGRGTNPEYTAKSSVSPSIGKANPAYFSSTYQPSSINQNLAQQPTGLNNLYNYNGFNNMGMNSFYGNGFNNGFRNNFAMNSFYGNGFNNFYLPYGGFGMGMSPYGMGMMGMNDPFGWGGYSSFGMMNGFGWPYSNFYGNNFYGNGFGNNFYPQTIIVVNRADASRGYTNGRGGRSGSDEYYTGNRTRGSVAAGSSSVSSAGRVASNQYYDRSWRSSVPQESQSRSYYGNTNTRSSWDSGNRQSGFENSRSSFNNGNSNGGFSGGSRSSGFSSGGGGASGGGGGGRSRN